MGTFFSLSEGNKADLPKNLSQGGIYFIKDEGSVYADLNVDDELVRINLNQYAIDQAKEYTNEVISTAVMRDIAVDFSNKNLISDVLYL